MISEMNYADEKHDSPERLSKVDILVVDDSPVDRLLLQAALERLGHKVTAVENAKQALSAMDSYAFQVIVTDWRMPELSGPEFCRKVRGTARYKSPYIILVTARNGKQDLVDGLDSGADDFLSKPINHEELRVRIQAGVRIVTLQMKTRLKNLELAKSLRREETTNRSIRQDLDTAATMQRKLLPDHKNIFPSLRSAGIFQPAVWLAGDGFNTFRLDKQTLGFYSIDISGHGLTSAMLSFAVTQMISFESRQSIDLGIESRDSTPAEVVNRLNGRFNQLENIHHYFTMIYGTICATTGKGQFCQAGHPCPLICTESGLVKATGAAGFPVGLLDDVQYQNTEFELHPSERLIIYSDGVTDSRNRAGESYSLEMFRDVLARTHPLQISTAADRISNEFDIWRNDVAPEDDISVLTIEYSPQS